MKLFDCFRKKPEPVPEPIEKGYQPHGIEFRYLCRVCLMRDYKNSDSCCKCRCECFPGFIPDTWRIEKLLRAEKTLSKWIETVDEIREDVLGGDVYDQQEK